MTGPHGGRRKLGPVLATMLVAGNMVGSSLYLLPASMGAIGSISILGWVVASLGAGLLAGVFCGLVRLRPRAEGILSHIHEALGPGAGFVAGSLYWLACWVGNVAIALAVTGYISVFVPTVAQAPGSTECTLVVLWLLVGANIVGPRFVADVEGWTLAIGLGPVLLLAVFGWFYFHPAVFLASWNVSGHSALWAMPRSVVIAFWGFLGLESAGMVAALVRDPQRDVPIATLSGLGLASIIYIAACGVIMGIIPATVLAHSAAPFAQATAPLLGALAGLVVAACAILKTSGALGGWILVAAETGEGEAVLGQVRRIQPRPPRHPSVTSLLITGVLMTLATLASASPTLGRQFSIITDVTVVMTMLVYIGACAALLRFSGQAPPRARLAWRALGVSAIVFSLAVVASSDPTLFIWTAGAVGMATIVYAGLSLRRRAMA